MVRPGWLRAELLTVDALDRAEDHLLLAGVTDEGAVLSDEQLTRLWTLGGESGAPVTTPMSVADSLSEQLEGRRETVRRTVSERNARFFEEEAAKLDGWADDLKVRPGT